MDLKVRFTLFFSLVILVFVGAFTVLVYSQVRNRVISTAQQSLSSHLEHEFHHLEGAATEHSSHNHSAHLKDIYQRVWRDDVLVEDSFPSGVSVPEPLGVQISDDRIIARLERVGEKGRIKILAYYNLASTLSYLATLRRTLAVAWLFSLLLVVPLSYVSTKLLLRPFQKLSSVAAGLDVQKLSFRFPEVGRADEYGILVRTFNALLKRLESSFSQARRFATNASHELRTPLAVIISQGERALRKSRDVEEYRTTIEKMLKQARTLTHITSRLLTLADIETAHQDIQRARIELTPTLEEIVQSLKVSSAGREKAVVLEKGADLHFRGNLPSFLSIATNLIENALKFAKSQVVVKVSKERDMLRMDIEDDGPGIPFAKRDRVFEPFYHDGLGTLVKGHGLGLSIVKTCVESFHGTIELGDSRLGGLVVTVQLPENA